MKRLFLILLAVGCLTSCVRTLSLPFRQVTVDFSQQLPDTSRLKFHGEQGQGNFTFVSTNGTVQQQFLPNFGTYAISWKLRPVYPSSCSIFFNYLVSGNVQTLEQPHDTTLTGVSLIDFYDFSVQCR